MAEQPTHESALTLATQLRAGELTASEVIDERLRRLAAHENLASFIHTNPDKAKKEAQQADETWQKAKNNGTQSLAELPPLHGIPIAHKDLMNVANEPRTMGTRALTVTIDSKDAPGAKTLRTAGAISLGKTQVPEFGLNCYSENLVAAPARNPLNPERTPGGSSGGSAAAVASRILPFAPGSDGGGSIRIPALACGLTGLKPGRAKIPDDNTMLGRLDQFGGPQLVVTGPLAHTAKDAAFLYDVMLGGITKEAARTTAAGNLHPETSPLYKTLRAVEKAAKLRKLKIGVSLDSPFSHAHEIPLSTESTRALQLAIETLKKLGHSVQEAPINYDPSYPEAFYTLWTSGLTTLGIAEKNYNSLTPLTRTFLERALQKTPQQRQAAIEQLQHFSDNAARQWARYDLLLTPGLAHTPPEVGAFTALSPDEDYRAQCQWTPYTSMVNVVGNPAVAVPITTSATGMPMGVQLIGAPDTETLLLQIAAQIEGAR